MAATGDRTYAAWASGYQHPQIAGSNLMAKPHVAAAVEDIRQRQMARLVVEGLPIAVSTAIELALSGKSELARGAAAKLIIDKSREYADTLVTRDETDVPAADLQRLLRRLEDDLMEMQRPQLELRSEPVSEGDAPSVMD